ncbi:efflux RND transporter periplasmic adaptor subunit [Ferrimonas pelagia]|uniref:Efflux RND transporter periplasmic adaptor subunit n=1 Tax=Ferrimonas pelagia TaxID=1177826 RepID=A0ABP9EHH5_9GAMM
MKNTSNSRAMAPLALSALALTLLTGCSEPPVVQTDVIRPVALYTIAQARGTQLREFPARIEAREETQLSFRVPGELLELPVLAGMNVEAGDLLARLDDRDYLNEVAARQADFDLASADFNRLKTLRAQDVVSQADFDNVKARRSAAQVALQMAQDRLADTRLEAPYSGRIAQRLVQNHQAIQAMQPVLLMQDSINLDVIIQVPENLLSQIREDQIDYSYQPEVAFAADPALRFPVSFKELATQITPGSQSFEVRFALTNPEQLTVLPGMAAHLTLDLERLQPDVAGPQRLLVPVTAVLKDNATGVDQLWVYRDGQVDPITVTVGEITQDGVKIEADLRDGDQIVAAGVSQLRPGMRVKPLKRERGI